MKTRKQYRLEQLERELKKQKRVKDLESEFKMSTLSLDNKLAKIIDIKNENA